CLLNWVQPAVTSQSFDGQYPRSVYLLQRHQAGVDHLSIQDYGARAALAFSAAFFSSGQSQAVTQGIEQPGHGLRNHLVRSAVYFEMHPHKVRNASAQRGMRNPTRV